MTSAVSWLAAQELRAEKERVQAARELLAGVVVRMRRFPCTRRGWVESMQVATILGRWVGLGLDEAERKLEEMAVQMERGTIP